MERTDFGEGWTFRLWGVPGDTPVSLPHDLSQHLPRSETSKSGSAGGWFRGGDPIYDKELRVTEEMRARRVMLEFEGVFPNAEVYLDDTLVVRQPCGYFSFLADLTPHLRPGIQKIRVNVHGDALPNARWYTGTGICRPVFLLQSGMACIMPWGLHAVTGTGNGGEWLLQTGVTLSPEAAGKGYRLRLTLRDPAGTAILRQTEEPFLATDPKAALAAGPVSPWGPEDPVLYPLTAELLSGETCLDSETVKVGFREVKLDREQGLLLNGRPILLRGGCVHHDNGLLGAVSLPDAEYRKALLLKKNRFNAVRCAHNPPAPAFLDACDAVGLLVMDEFTDVWNIGKNPYDYHLHFRDRWRQDLKSMILRDRNHPSVILWSIGNEIPERDGSGNGYALCEEMCAAVRETDPTRLVTAALNNIGKRRLDMLAANLQSDDPDSIDYFGALSERFLSPLDVAGYNYLSRRYEKDLAAYPDRFLCGTESVAKEALEYWQKTLSLPRVIGDFAWAALDYLGEAGIGHVWYRPEDGEGYFEKWPWRQANCADIDLCGERTPAGFYRQAVWGTLESPRLAVQHPSRFHRDGSVSYWAWPERCHAWAFPGWEGKPVQVDVYSAGKQITLLLNGQEVRKAVCRDRVASFDVPYAPGLLEAVDERGNRDKLQTPGSASQLLLEAVQVGELVFLTAQIADARGIPCFFDGREICFSCLRGELLAVGSADPASEEGFRGKKARAYHGRVSAVIRCREGVRVLVSADGLETAAYPPAQS